MKHGTYILVVISLLIGLTVAPGCTEGKEGPAGNSSGGGPAGNSPGMENFSTIVEMNGKELTLSAPAVRYVTGVGGYPEEGFVVVTVQNSGDEPITLAEFELIGYGRDGLEIKWRYWDETYKAMVVVKQLSCGEVCTVCWPTYRTDIVEPGIEAIGSLRVNVNRLE